MEPHRLALPAGYRIENYEIQTVLGKGGFGITYVAYDWSLGRHIAIKELLPDSIATRIDGSTVVAMGPSQEESWAWARERFIEEARILAVIRHPNIIAVHRLIEANGTVYLVMDHIEGESYEQYLQSIVREPQERNLMVIMSPFIAGLKAIHALGLLHRDIKPDNILLTSSGQPVLIDFGNARELVGKTVTMTSIVTHGYSPIEQYQTKGRMGPWTDIYAVAALMCRAITGEKPPVASDRIMEDDFQWLSYRQVAGFSEPFLQSADWALRVRPEERPTTIHAWASCFGSGLREPDAEQNRTAPSIQWNAVVEGEAPSAPTSLPDPKPATKEPPFVNSLGMKFVPVPGTDVLFSIWDTRVKDFRAYAEATGYRQQGGIYVWDGSKWKLAARANWEKPGFAQTVFHPVVGVSWEEAKSFCKWLTAKEQGEGKIGKDQEYRLPTDAEWSVAVGSGKYPWGNEWQPPKGAGNYDPSLGVDSYVNTSPVGSFSANRFGLYDMGGNVWQWCEDFYSADKKYRALRGGSWSSIDPESLLSSYRNRGSPDSRASSRGFRCVLGSSR